MWVKQSTAYVAEVRILGGGNSELYIAKWGFAWGENLPVIGNGFGCFHPFETLGALQYIAMYGLEYQVLSIVSMH